MNTGSLLLVLFTVAFVYGQQCPRCTPYCKNGDGTNKLCGNDGCGGSCGTCASGQECCRGQCVCAPNCQGRQCGDDGCGGNSCGSCANGQTCQNGVCVGTGVRTCDNRQCGSDRIGGSCGSCSAGQRCRGGACECYYDCNDRNCGLAPQEAGTFCASQSCGTCPSGFTCDTNGRCSALAPCSVNIVIVDTTTSSTVSGSCTVDITGVSMTYTLTGFRWSSPSTAWDVGGGFGTYSFRTNCAGYQISTEQSSISSSSTTVTLHVTPAAIPVEVRESGASAQLTVSCSITASNGRGYISTFSWLANTGVVFNGVSTAGFGTYEFQTSCVGYSVSTESKTLTSSTTVIQLTVRKSDLTIEVRESVSNNLITVSATISVSFGSTSYGTINWIPGTTNKWSVPAGYGTYTFRTTTSKYNPSTETRDINANTAVVILYVAGCGDGVCQSDQGEEWTDAGGCRADCARINLIMSDWGGNTPVKQFTVSLYDENPRILGGFYGPVPDPSAVPSLQESAAAGSNNWQRSTFDHDQIVHIKIVFTGYVDFYWVADLTKINHTIDFFKLYGHMAQSFNEQSFPYKAVLTWRTADDLPEPYSPVDFNLHLFSNFAGSNGKGACDGVTANKNNSVNGILTCKSYQDSKLSGGPASVEFDIREGDVYTFWVAVPPRDWTREPAYANRYLVNGDFFVVVYGVTGDAPAGKQLAEFTLDETLELNPSAKGSKTLDLWRGADIQVEQRKITGLTVTKKLELKTSTINSRTSAQTINCEIGSHCSAYVVPYADSGDRR